MDNNIIKIETKKFIKSRFQFALATNGDHPWIATMYYGSDDHFNLYFLTDPDSIHAQSIIKNPLVSVVIADSPQVASGNKCGIQMYGNALILKDQKDLEAGFAIWNKALGVTDQKYSYEGINSGSLKYRLYKFVPKKIKYYNEELWENDEVILDF